jgi:hypothetical protein
MSTSGCCSIRNTLLVKLYTTIETCFGIWVCLAQHLSDTLRPIQKLNYLTSYLIGLFGLPNIFIPTSQATATALWGPYWYYKSLMKRQCWSRSSKPNCCYKYQQYQLLEIKRHEFHHKQYRTVWAGSGWYSNTFECLSTGSLDQNAHLTSIPSARFAITKGDCYFL